MTKKAAKRLFMLRFLRKSSCPSNIMLRVYHSVIQPVLLYGFPAFCNAPKHLLEKVKKLERRAMRTIGISEESNFVSTAEASCGRIIVRITEHANHPLRELFFEREPTRSNKSKLRPLFAKTKRLKNSHPIFKVILIYSSLFLSVSSHHFICCGVMYSPHVDYL